MTGGTQRPSQQKQTPPVNSPQGLRPQMATGSTSRSPNYAPSAPNYNVFISHTTESPPTGQKAAGSWGSTKIAGNAFDDILGAQGFKATTPQEPNKPSRLKDLKKEQEKESGADPVTLMIREWADGRERNIRALLTSMSEVLWEGEDKWKPPQMHELLKPAQVKKHYYKACLATHPDKHGGTPHEALARAIFMELNEAWRIHEESGQNF